MGDSAQNTRSRGRLCPTGWAAQNGDASALVDAADTLNCDEFAFARYWLDTRMSPGSTCLYGTPGNGDPVIRKLTAQ